MLSKISQLWGIFVSYELKGGYSGIPLPPRGTTIPPTPRQHGRALRNSAWRGVFIRSKCMGKRKNNLEKTRFVLYCKLASVLYKLYITQYILSFFIIIRWISFWTRAHWASFGCLQLCNISNPKKPGDYRVLYVPQVPVNARVNGKPTLVDTCIFAVHPCSSDTRRLFEHLHVKHIQFTCEVSSRRESCSSGSDDTHSQELPHSFTRGKFSS